MGYINEWIEETYNNFPEFMTFMDNPTSSNYHKFTRKAYFNYDDYFEDCAFKSGATRAVIIFEDYDFVLKIPFCDCNKNYCQEEVNIYQYAREVGAEDLFAETHFVMQKSNALCYEMEKVWCDEDEVTDVAFSICKDSNNFDSEDDIIDYIEYNDEFFEDLIPNYYGIDMLNRYHLVQIKFNINDLHRGNMGFKDGKIILVDYTCYEG